MSMHVCVDEKVMHYCAYLKIKLFYEDNKTHFEGRPEILRV